MDLTLARLGFYPLVNKGLNPFNPPLAKTGYMSGEEETRQHKTRSVTFRVDSGVIDEMQAEADNREISLNVLVNQVLKKYTEWDRYENKVGMMPVPKAMLLTIIDKSISLAKGEGIKDIAGYRDQIVKHAAQMAFDIMKDTVLFMKKKYNLWVVLDVLEEYMKVSGIQADHRIEGSRNHVFVIKHELGENWSLFTKELLSLIFEKLANIKAEITVTPNTTVATVIFR